MQILTNLFNLEPLCGRTLYSNFKTNEAVERIPTLLHISYYFQIEIFYFNLKDTA